MDFMPFDSDLAIDGMEVAHNLNGEIKGAFLIAWKAPKHVAGAYSRLPYIQYLDSDGEPCIASNRDRQYIAANPSDLLVENEQQQA